MWEAIIVGLFGAFFFILGVRHNNKLHQEESTGTGVNDSLILSLLIDGFFWIIDQLPYWVAKTLFFLLAFLLFIWSSILFIS